MLTPLLLTRPEGVRGPAQGGPLQARRGRVPQASRPLPGGIFILWPRLPRQKLLCHPPVLGIQYTHYNDCYSHYHGIQRRDIGVQVSENEHIWSGMNRSHDKLEPGVEEGQSQVIQDFLVQLGRPLPLRLRLAQLLHLPPETRIHITECIFQFTRVQICTYMYNTTNHPNTLHTLCLMGTDSLAP